VCAKQSKCRNLFSLKYKVFGNRFVPMMAEEPVHRRFCHKSATNFLTDTTSNLGMTRRADVALERTTVEFVNVGAHSSSVRATDAAWTRTAVWLLAGAVWCFLVYMCLGTATEVKSDILLQRGGSRAACRNASEVSGAIFPIQAFSMTFFRPRLGPLPESVKRPKRRNHSERAIKDFFI